MPEKNISRLVVLGEESELKVKLNEGVASLKGAEKSYFQPHVCLNGMEGIEIIDQITQNPTGANTEVCITDMAICSANDIWANVMFVVFLNELSSNSIVCLTPRQTTYIVKNLPPEFSKAVLDQIKNWCLQRFLTDMEVGLNTIKAQLEKGDLLKKESHWNRIFDVPDESRTYDCPYTEGQIAGERLFSELAFGQGPNPSPDCREGYETMDQIVMQSKMARTQRASQLVNAVQTLHSLLG